jgi:hypothetical protein
LIITSKIKIIPKAGAIAAIPDLPVEVADFELRKNYRPAAQGDLSNTGQIWTNYLRFCAAAAEDRDSFHLSSFIFVNRATTKGEVEITTLYPLLSMTRIMGY